MLNINKAELRDKVYACWLGKNLGGTLGGPFECRRGVVECDGFTTEPGKPLPNDDLDLQLVWLMAMHDEGPQNVDAALLGEYWLEYISPYWAEYGACKSNMRFGLNPPLSGEYQNRMKKSNGAWIRTEVWAALYPGDPARAVYYATEDASVDHGGTGEGTYAARFVAAMESAAYFVKDIRELITIGLSYLPETCHMRAFVEKTLACRDAGMTWLEARNTITELSLSIPELGWMGAPANVCYTLIGLLWGGLDFKESMLTACRCGDDTDCTCATLGSILGILYGTEIIPKDWLAYIGDDIVTISVNRGATRSFYSINHAHFRIPDTCTQLTDAIMEMHPITLFTRPVTVWEGETTQNADPAQFRGRGHTGIPYCFRTRSVLADYTVIYDGAPEIAPGETKKITVSIHNRFLSQKEVSVTWTLPEGWTVSGRQTAMLPQTHEGAKKLEYFITANETVGTKNTAFAYITFGGHCDAVCLPVILLG